MRLNGRRAPVLNPAVELTYPFQIAPNLALARTDISPQKLPYVSCSPARIQASKERRMKRPYYLKTALVAVSVGVASPVGHMHRHTARIRPAQGLADVGKGRAMMNYDVGDGFVIPRSGKTNDMLCRWMRHHTRGEGGLVRRPRERTTVP